MMQLCSRCKKELEDWPLEEDLQFTCSTCLTIQFRELVSHLEWPWGPVRLKEPSDN